MIPENDHDGRSRQVKRAEACNDPLKKDFRRFLWVMWKHLGLPPPTDVQLDIAHFLQHGPRRKMVQAFRGVGKTWVYGAFVAWLLYCDPNIKIMVVSASKPYADNLSKFVKQLIEEVPILRHLRPQQGQNDSFFMFDVGPARTSKDPSVKSTGIFGQITGSRADVILADDIESLNNSATEGSRERLSEAIKEFDAVLKPGGSITYLGTPQSFMSMYRVLPERGYTIRIWPARIPEKAEQYEGQLAPFITRLMQSGAPKGTPVDPKRFDHTDLMEREASYGPSGFRLQFMLDTSFSDRDRFPLRLSNLLVHPLDTRMAPTRFAWAGSKEYEVEGLHTPGLPGDRFHKPMYVSETMADYTGSVMSIDPSGQGKDETAYAVVKHLGGWLFLTAIGGLDGGYDDDTLDGLVKIAKAQEVNVIRVESNFGQGMFAKLLQASLKRGGYRCQVEEVRAAKQKELRIIDTLEPVLASHRLVVCKTIINADYETAEDPSKSAFYQLTRITREKGCLKHDDRLDALSDAVSHWVEQMGQDQSLVEDKRKEKLREQELRKFLDGVLGGGPKRPKWVHARSK
jgi:hypothetical protein